MPVVSGEFCSVLRINPQKKSVLLRGLLLFVARIHEAAMASRGSEIRIAHRHPVRLAVEVAQQFGVGFELFRASAELAYVADYHAHPAVHGSYGSAH